MLLISLISVVIWYIWKKKHSKVKATELLDDKDYPEAEKRDTENSINQNEENTPENKLIN